MCNANDTTTSKTVKIFSPFRLNAAQRKVLDDAGLRDARIMATGDLNEYKIQELLGNGAPIDAFGVGTDLATSADSPSLGGIYKLTGKAANLHVAMHIDGVLEGRYDHSFTSGM